MNIEEKDIQEGLDKDNQPRKRAKTTKLSITEHKEIREFMTDRMMGNASEMKQIASQFGNRIKADQSTLDEIELKQDKNLKDTKKDNDRLREMNFKANMNFCMRILTLLFSFVLFWFMFFLIRLFPLKIYLER